MDQPDLYERVVKEISGETYNLRTAPVDTLMNAPYGTHARVAFAMENDDDTDFEA